MRRTHSCNTTGLPMHERRFGMLQFERKRFDGHRQLPHTSITFVGTDPSGGERRDVIRIRGQHQLRSLLDARQEICVTHQVRDAQLGQAGLPGAEQLTRSSQLEVAAGDLETIVGLADHLEAFARKLRQGAAIEQHAGAGLRSATYTTAKLMELREAHAFGVLDDHQRGVRHVHADFDDGRGDEELNLPRLEGEHRLIFLRRRHATVHEADLHFRQRFRELSGGVFGGLRGHFVGLFDERADLVNLPPLATGSGDSRDDLARRSSGTTTVLIGVRPGGSSSITEMSRSAYSVMARVRGIGVAVMTIWMRRATFLAALLLQPQALLHAEPVLFVDDDQRELREVDAFLKQGVVPTMMRTSPEAMASSALRRTFAGCEPETRATGRFSG